MIELTCEADIRCPAPLVFDTITDFGGQERWLSRSSAYHGTTLDSPGPVGLVTLGIPWPLRVIQPVLIRAFRTESERTLLALKAHADARGQP